MLENLYTNIKIHLSRANFYFNDSKLEQIPVTNHQFPTSENTIDGSVEFLNDKVSYISGRHIFKDNLMYKGVGYSKHYNLKKQRAILGGMTFNSALREFINSRVLLINDLTDIQIKAIGYLNDHPEHHFVAKTHHFPRLGFVANSDLNPQNILELKALYNTTSTSIINNFINRFFTLFFNGILHTSFNEFNLDINGDIIDFEGFYLAHSKTHICVPISLDITHVGRENIQEVLEKSIKEKNLTHHYISDFISVLSYTLIPFLNKIFQKEIDLNKILSINPNWIFYKNEIVSKHTQVKIIEIKDVYDKKFVYAELVVPKTFISEIKHKKLIKLALNSNFQEIALNSPSEIVHNIFLKTKDCLKNNVLDALTKLIENDSNISCARITGSLAVANTLFDSSSDIDLYLEVKANRLFYKEQFKNFLAYPVDIVIKEQLDNKPHLKWHFLKDGLTLKGNFEPQVNNKDFFNFISYTLNNCGHILQSIRKESLSKEIQYPAPTHFFKGYLIPLGNDLYSLRYIQTLAAFYSFQKLYYNNIFCPNSFKKSQLIKDFLAFVPKDEHYELIKDISHLTEQENRIIHGKKHLDKIVPITNKLIELEKSCYQSTRLNNSL
jgi:predicted nucleotidyltransferase